MQAPINLQGVRKIETVARNEMESGFEKGTLTLKPASFNHKERISSQQSAVGKEVLVMPKRVARKRSGGVFANQR